MSKRTLTQLQGIGIPLLRSKSKQAAFHQVLWLCHQATFFQLETEGKRSASPASFVSRDLQSNHPLTFLLPPSLGPVLSFPLLFLPFFVALAKPVSLFSLKTQLSSFHCLAFAQNELWHQDSPHFPNHLHAFKSFPFSRSKSHTKCSKMSFLNASA